MLNTRSLCAATNKLLVGLVLAAALTLAGSTSANAAIPSDTCFDFDETTGTITNYKSDVDSTCPTDLEIPSEINNIPVVTIGDYAFTQKGLTQATIPSTVKSIEYSAFSGNELTTITIPSSVETIGYKAFAWNKLEQVNFNEGLVTLGENAFAYNMLRSVTVPSTLNSPLFSPLLFILAVRETLYAVFLGRKVMPLNYS